MKAHKLSVFNIAFLFVGAIMGAGFASGREIWQFFGVFGSKSYGGIAIVSFLFIFFGMMSIKVSQKLGSTDIVKMILPFENPVLERILGWIIVGFLFLIYTTTSAAGGALFQEQLGLHKAVGGIFLMLVMVATVLGGFQRISKYFKWIVPTLLVVVFGICMYIVFADIPPSNMETMAESSPMAPTWYFSAIIYISYNMLGGIVILGSSAHQGVGKNTALKGAVLGGVLLGIFVLIMNCALFKDTGLASNSVLPILAFSDKINSMVRVVYALLLLAAIYVTATSNFYGLTTRVKPGKKKPYIIIATAFVGFLMGLMGFVKMVAWVLPLEGYFGLAFLVLMTINFIKLQFQKCKVEEDLSDGGSQDEPII
ncbi:MAG: hypothetical protein RR131_02660 [Anaerovorax sp.]